MPQERELTRPKLIRSSGLIHDDASMHMLESLREFEFALQQEIINVHETSVILGVSRQEAARFYQHFQDTKTILAALYQFFDRNQLQQVLSNILNFY